MLVHWLHLIAKKAEPVVTVASLGAWGNPQNNKVKIEEEIIEEPIPAKTINKIRKEFLSESMAQDLINRARKRKSRADEEALLLIL